MTKKRMYSDAELLTLELSCTDPYAVEGVVFEKKPDDVEFTNILSGYHFERWPDEKVLCCDCGRINHQNGFFAECSDGTKRTLGWCCTEKRRKAGDLNTSTLVRTYRTDVHERQKYVKRLYALGPVLLRAQKNIGTWHKLGRQIWQAHIDFRAALPDVFELVQQAARDDGVLMTTRRERRLNINGRNNKNKDKDNDYKWVEARVRYRMSGYAFLRPGNPTRFVDKLDEQIRYIRTIAEPEKSDSQSTGKLKAAIVGLEKALQNVRELEDMRLAIGKFFQAENLEGIQQWAELMRQGHDKRLSNDVEVRNGALHNVQTGRSFSRPVLEVPDEAIFDLLSSSREAA